MQQDLLLCWEGIKRMAYLERNEEITQEVGDGVEKSDTEAS